LIAAGYGSQDPTICSGILYPGIICSKLTVYKPADESEMRGTLPGGKKYDH
jgi:hypothetical protein